MEARLIGPLWTGLRVPEEMRCGVEGAASPPILVTDIPTGTLAILIEFNDLDYEPLSARGGHGIVGYRVYGDTGSFTAASVPELEADKLPPGVWIFANNRGRFPVGYRAPCGGRVKEHCYEATVLAVADYEGKKVLASVKLPIGCLQ